MSGIACPGGYICFSTLACGTTCGALAGTDGCQGGYYCDGFNGGHCQMQGATGSQCMQGYECTSGTCTAGSCT
jgi:hypothetical protein